MALDSRTILSRMIIGNLDLGLILVMRPNPQTFQKSSNKIVNEVLTNSGYVDTHWGNQRDIITVSGISASKIGNPNQYNKDEFLTATTQSFDNTFKSNHGSAKHGPKQWADVDRFMLKMEQIYKTDKERVGSLMDLAKGNFLTTAALAPLSFGTVFKNRDSGTSLAKDIQDNRKELLKSIREGYASRAQSFIIYDYCIYWGYFTSFSYTESATDKPRQYQYNFVFRVVNSSTDWLSQSLISNFPEARILNLFSQIGELGDFAKGLVTSGDKILKNIFI